MDLDLADPCNGHSQLDIDILIGSDQYWELVTGKICRGCAGPDAIETEIGWVSSGSVPTAGTAQHSILTRTHVLKINAAPDCNEQRKFEQLLQSFLDLESLGIVGTKKTLYDDFCNCVTVQDGQYKVSLPWRDAHKPQPDNYNLS